MKRALASLLLLAASLAAQAVATAPTASLDASFGRGGVEYTNLGAAVSGMNGVTAMALQPDGKIVVVGLGLTQFNTAPLLARFNADGTIDPSFNSTGYTTANPAGMTSANALALQADGKIVVGGSNGALAVARFNTNGTLDTTFNGTGFRTTVVGGGAGANAVAIQGDGKIVAAGFTQIAPSINVVLLVRYNADGSLDNSFSDDGITSNASPLQGALAAVLQGDGKIVVGGSSGSDFAVARFNPDGSLDTTFNGNGSTVTSLSPNSDVVRSLAIASDGKIVAAGLDGGPTCCLDGPGFGIARYNTDGTLDTTFGGGTGHVYRSFGRVSAGATSVAVLPDRRILVAGFHFSDPATRVAIVRLTEAGDTDGSFSLTSRAPYGFFGSEGFNAIALQPDGKVVAAGSTGPKKDYLLLRLSAFGSTDASFGRAGEVRMPSALRDDAAYALAIQSDGKIVAAGATDDLVAFPDPLTLARYGTDGRPDDIFGAGRANYAASSNPLSSTHAYALAIEGDGRLLLAGDVVTNGFNTGSFPTSNFLLARVDTSTFAGSVVATAQATFENFSTAKAVRIQSDGKIVAAGFTRTNASFQPPGTKHFALVRYNADLSLDTAFNGTGKVATPLGTGDAEANAVAIRSDGSIIAAGSARNAANQDWAFLLYSAAGTPTGSILLDVSTGSDDAVYAMAIQPDGAIVVAGAAGSQAALARFTSPGIYDGSFGNGGKFRTAGAPFAAVALQADGKIVAVTRDFQVWRLMASGMPDWTFGVGGRFALTMGAGSNANAVAVQSDGRIIVAGNADGGFGQDFVVARIDPGIGPSLVTHYYQSILRRAPDTGGKAYWDSEALRVSGLGANVNEAWFAMAQTFFTSPEYAAFNRDNTAFVTDLYTTFFDRAPDAGGLAYWKGQLDSGLPREVLLAQFMFSAEFTAFTQAIFGNPPVRAEVNAVTDFYRGLLARLPDNGGFTYWVGRFRTAQCQGQAAIVAEAEAISSAFTLSGEYASRGRTNAQYVGDLYNAFLRRGGDLTGVQFWINEIGTGARTREQVRMAFRDSPEFQARVTAIIQQGCL